MKDQSLVMVMEKTHHRRTPRGKKLIVKCET